jgi:hypothetical protein
MNVSNPFNRAQGCLGLVNGLLTFGDISKNDSRIRNATGVCFHINGHFCNVLPNRARRVFETSARSRYG